MVDDATPPVALAYDIPRLLQMFESLGENCDFGVVQRAAGIEPFGLFRFAACNAGDLAALLGTQLDPLGTPEDLWLEEVGPQREYCIKSRRCSFEAHTDSYAGQDAADAVHKAQLRKLRFLKAQLLRDLSSGHKIFVLKGNPDFTIVRAILTALRGYGANCLLWVNVADAVHPPGSVERQADGLLCGFVSRFGTYYNDPSVPVEDWVTVCANAYRLLHGVDPPSVPLDNLILEAAAKQTWQWVVGESAATRLLSDLAPTGGMILEHQLTTTEPTSVLYVYFPIAAGGHFAFSVWIQIPESFRGRSISAVLLGVPSAASWKADVTARGQWQRVWVSASVPADSQNIACGILAEGMTNDIFQSASWCLERGNRPLGYGFAPMMVTHAR